MSDLKNFVLNDIDSPPRLDDPEGALAGELGSQARWRSSVRAGLAEWRDMVTSFDLLSQDTADRIESLREKLQSDKVTIAFVAEFSRGKSELINALFFSEFGRRIMPASAGRTTMCPTEIGYQENVPTSLRLLPIETRLVGKSLMECRNGNEGWVIVPLNISDPDDLAQQISRVAEVNRVQPSEAIALGFGQANGVEDSIPVDQDGLVEIPRWRHAIVNIPHPLLKKGLVILDTPGLNAIGAEPELTISLLPDAHAVLFILGADTGVTQSDLSIWRDHLCPSGSRSDGKIVVLNKIDTLWDELRSFEEIDAQISKQVIDSAKILSVSVENVLAVSAQKALVAKIGGDFSLLERSRISYIERALAEGLLLKKRSILFALVEDGVSEITSRVAQASAMRVRDLTEQLQELESLRGKNSAVISHMRKRIEIEQKDFESGGIKIQAVRAVHSRLLKDLFQTLGHGRFRHEVMVLMQKLRQPGIKVGVRKCYEDTFESLRLILSQAQRASAEIYSMLSGSFSQLNAEFGLSVHLSQLPSIDKYIDELNEIEASHIRYLSVGNFFRLSQADFCERLGRVLSSRLRIVYDSAANDLELWNKTAVGQLDAQLRERRRSLSKRIEAVTRIHNAAGDLVGRIQELDEQIKSEHSRMQSIRDAGIRFIGGY